MEADVKKHTIIFYADDDIDDLEFFIDALEERRDSVSLFELGDKMLQALRNPPPKPSIIFLDLNMPIKSGFDILREINLSPAFRDIPVLILTTSINENDVIRAKELGARMYIRKPTSIIELKKTMTYILSIDWENFNPTAKEFLYKQ